MNASSNPDPGASPAITCRLLQWQIFVPIAFTMAVLVAAFVSGIRSGVRDLTSHLLISRSAITAAVSSEFHGLRGRPYQGFVSVRTALEKNGYQVPEDNHANFRDYASLMTGLRAAEAAETCGSPLISAPFNDQGVFDFVHGAFALFGADIRSLYDFYFLLFGMSATIYLACFWRSYAACTLLFACACAIYSFMPSYINSNTELISVSNPRFLSTLGIIPLFHLFMMFIKTYNPRINWVPLIGVICQTSIMSLAIAARSTGQWMEIAFAILLVGYLGKIALSAQRLTALQQFLIGRGSIAICVVATLAVIGSVRALSLPPDCGTALNGHPFWHNMFLGLTFNPDWKARARADYGYIADLRGDAVSFRMAGLYVERHHLPYQTKPSIWVETAQTRVAGVDPAPLGSWRVYESVLRSAFFEFVRAHPAYAIKTFLIYKPLRLLENIGSFLAVSIHDLTPLDFSFFIAMIVVIGAVATSTKVWEDFASRLRRLLLLVIFCCAASTIPLLVVYPTDFLIADPAYLVITVIVTFLIWVIASVERLFVPRRGTGGAARTGAAGN